MLTNRLHSLPTPTSKLDLSTLIGLTCVVHILNVHAYVFFLLDTRPPKNFLDH